MKGKVGASGQAAWLPELGDPGGHDLLDLVLPDSERVRMTYRGVAHVQDVVANIAA